MDRRAVWAIILMMVIALVPALFLKPTRRAGAPGTDSTAAGQAVSPPGAGTPVPSGPPAAAPTAQPPSAPADTAADTVLVTSPLYTYGLSTRGGRLVRATLTRYPSMAVTSG